LGLFLLLLLLSRPLFAAPLTGTPLNDGYYALYNLDFASAHAHFQQWMTAHPEDPLGPASDAAAYIFNEFDLLGVLDIELFADDNRFESRTRPAVGNHEFYSASAAYYFDYFGAAAGDPKDGYYSYDLGSWHIIVLNSECKEVGGCDAGSREEKWLRADLAAHPAACTLAYFHKPLFSSGGRHGDDLEIKSLWRALYDGNATVVVSGHDHDYERFAPQDPDGKADPKRGIREFVVGTGGKNHRPFEKAHANSELRDDTAFGILKLTLRPGSYDWQFLPEPGKSFSDSGSATCH